MQTQACLKLNHFKSKAEFRLEQRGLFKKSFTLGLRYDYELLLR